ncbi:MAG: hypothetical protein ACYC63_00490 [Armatimonadota bacterium]
MTEPDTILQLTVEQQRAIDLLLQGKSEREVAAQVGVARQTVSIWCNHHPAFQAELHRQRQELWSAQTERLRGLVSKAVDVLEEDLAAVDPRLRQSAAVHILKSVGSTVSQMAALDQQLRQHSNLHWEQQVHLTGIVMAEVGKAFCREQGLPKPAMGRFVELLSEKIDLALRDPECLRTPPWLPDGQAHPA